MVLLSPEQRLAADDSVRQHAYYLLLLLVFGDAANGIVLGKLVHQSLLVIWYFAPFRGSRFLGPIFLVQGLKIYVFCFTELIYFLKRYRCF